MAEQLIYDPAYEVVPPEDFRAMIEVDRYGKRSSAFDGIISATHDHFWTRWTRPTWIFPPRSTSGTPT